MFSCAHHLAGCLSTRANIFQHNSVFRPADNIQNESQRTPMFMLSPVIMPEYSCKTSIP